MTYMNLISFCGLITMLLLAWSISYHRTRVKLRPIFWGMGLQLILAFTILYNNYRSFYGMVVLGLLLSAYVMRTHRHMGKESANHVLHGALGLILGGVFYGIGGAIPLMGVTALSVVFMILNATLFKQEGLKGWGAIVFLSSSVAHFIREGIYGNHLFNKLSTTVEEFLGLADYGSLFLFGNLANPDHFFSGNEFFPGFGFVFAFKVLPTIIYFGGFMSILYYLGVIQKVVSAMSHFMRWTMGTSGAETLSCSANVFIGQTEAPLLIKPFIGEMTHSELLTIMVGGFATIAGGVLAGYIGMGVNAGHLITASVMSAPAALVIGKIIYPETEHSATAGDVEMPHIDSGSNILEAAANGITDGFKLALNVGAMLIGFIALIAVLDVILNALDSVIDGTLLGGKERMYAITGSSPVVKEYEGIFPGSLQTFFGTVLRPLAFVMGVPWEDAPLVGNLLGVKLTLNEFVAFGSLGTYVQTEAMGERAIIISTYALCGFANFSSIGIQLGGIGSIAPERRSDLAKVVFKAMIGGALASWTTACVAGMLLSV